MNLFREAIYEAHNWWTACTWTEKNIPNLEGKTILVTGDDLLCDILFFAPQLGCLGGKQLRLHNSVIGWSSLTPIAQSCTQQPAVRISLSMTHSH